MRNFRIVILIFLISYIGEYASAQTYTDEEGFKKKSKLIIDLLADSYQPPSLKIGDPEKYCWPKVMARFLKYGVNDEKGNYYINELHTRPPFHFTLVGMARILFLFPDAPSIKTWNDTLLQNVYSRNDSYNSWTAEGTENHINMSRCSGYLYAQLTLNNPNFPDAFVKLKSMEDWIRKWSKTVYERGNGEWNSSSYGAYNISPWINLYDFAKDPNIKAIAKAVCDFYACEFAVNYSWGTIGNAEMRGGGVPHANGSSTNIYSWLWFGENSQILPSEGGTEYIQSIHAITSSYRPPEIACQIARKKNITLPEYIEMSRPSYLYETPSFVKMKMYIDSSFTLGSAVNKYGGWTGSTSQIVNWKLVSKDDVSIFPNEVSGNGSYGPYNTGKQRDPFTQWFQHKNVLIQMTKVPENYSKLNKDAEKITKTWGKNWENDFLKRFPNETYKNNVVTFTYKVRNQNKSFVTVPDKVSYSFDSIHFVDLGKTYLAVYSISKGKLRKRTENETGRCLIFDSTKIGSFCGIVVEVDEKSNYSDFLDFQSKILKFNRLNTTNLLTESKVTYVSLKNDTIAMQFVAEGTHEEAIVDWGYGVDKQQNVITSPPFLKPTYKTCIGCGRLANGWVNQKLVTNEDKTPLFYGRNIKMNNSILELKWNNLSYKVDYSRDNPVFH